MAGLRPAIHDFAVFAACAAYRGKAAPRQKAGSVASLTEHDLSSDQKQFAPRELLFFALGPNDGKSMRLVR